MGSRRKSWSGVCPDVSTPLPRTTLRKSQQKPRATAFRGALPPRPPLVTMPQQFLYETRRISSRSYRPDNCPCRGRMTNSRQPAHLYRYPGFSASFSSRFPSLLSESNAHTSSLLRSCTHGLTCQHRGILALGLSLLCLNLLILRSRPRISYTMHTAELNATGSSRMDKPHSSYRRHRRTKSGSRLPKRSKINMTFPSFRPLLFAVVSHLAVYILYGSKKKIKLNSSDLNT